MNASEDYVADLFAELQRLRTQEMAIIEKMINHFVTRDQDLHERYMRLDTEGAILKGRIIALEIGEDAEGSEQHT